MYFNKELSMSEPVTYRNKETNQKKKKYIYNIKTFLN